MSTTKNIIPSADELFPCEFAGKSICFLKNSISNPAISVGEYTYYHDENGADSFEEKNVLYHYEHCGDSLKIGKFCQIAEGTQFIMNGALHPLKGVSTFPFDLFGGTWSETGMANFDFESKGDTVVGNDVWFGKGALIMPGITIGNGAVIAAHSVVTKDVEDYTIVGGNPAQTIRKRYSENEVEELLSLKWWDWPVENITDNIAAIMKGEIATLIKADPKRSVNSDAE